MKFTINIFSCNNTQKISLEIKNKNNIKLKLKIAGVYDVRFNVTFTTYFKKAILKIHIRNKKLHICDTGGRFFFFGNCCGKFYQQLFNSVSKLIRS